MIVHIVTFTLSDTSDAHLAECRRRLVGLLDVVPTLRSMRAGANVVESTRAHDFALVATFDDLAGLEAYQVHPAHQEVATLLRAKATGSVAVDFVDADQAG